MKPLRERMISLKREGRKLLGCFPLYPPLALFHAMALEPVVRWGFKPFSPNTPKADRHVQNYVCSVGGHLVESVLSDACSLLDAIIVPTELLKGFDVVVCAPESHSAMSSARKVGALQCEKAEGLGYSTDLCSYARIQNRGWCCYGLDLRYKALSAMIERFSIDGIVFASNRSCKVYSVMQMDLMKLLMRKHGIPAVMIDVDHADPRKYSEAKAFIQLEALLENLQAGRMIDRGLDATKEAAMAKLVATEGAFEVIHNAMQIMGGIGYTTDYSIERHFRDARNGLFVAGSSEMMRLIIQRDTYKELLGP